MGEVTGIAWTHHTWSPWLGCARVSPGCEHCYAETLAKRFPQVHGEWGVEAAGGTRVVASAQSWREVLRWNERAAKDGVRRRIFPSMCDPFDTHPTAEMARPWLWALIEATPHLDWLLLTKRVENVERMVPWRWLGTRAGAGPAAIYQPRWPRNAWLGTTVEDQRRADERIPLLVNLPAPVRFLSVEPQLEHVDLQYAAFNGADSFGSMPGIHWVICGGESVPHARPFDLAWARSLRDQCAQAGVAFFFKQMGARPVGLENHHGAILPEHPAGADPAEFPADLRVQQFPDVR